jgi:F0F1-type ATP synthase membrane subunit b/b'
MEQERDRMIGDLKAAFADLAVLGASQVIDREIKTDDHKRLLDQLLEGIDEEMLRTIP